VSPMKLPVTWGANPNHIKRFGIVVMVAVQSASGCPAYLARIRLFEDAIPHRVSHFNVRVPFHLVQCQPFAFRFLHNRLAPWGFGVCLICFPSLWLLLVSLGVISTVIIKFVSAVLPSLFLVTFSAARRDAVIERHFLAGASANVADAQFFDTFQH
jgi:hypothetical protein